MSRVAVCTVDRWQLTVAQAKAGGRLALVKAAAEAEQGDGKQMNAQGGSMQSECWPAVQAFKAPVSLCRDAWCCTLEATMP